MRKIRGIDDKDVVFIDIETARQVEKLEEGTAIYEAWKHKKSRQAEENDKTIEELFYDSSGFFPEYSKVICITVGRIAGEKIVLTTYKNHDERKLLEDFTYDLDKVCKLRPNTALCGHNVIGFDIPFLFRRCMANQVIPNYLIDVGWLKPWEVTALDTVQIWKGSSRYSSSLADICFAMGIKTPKGKLDGSEVADVYWLNKTEGLDIIAEYCEGDVVALVNVFRKMKFESVLIDIERNVAEPKPEESYIDRIERTGKINERDKAVILEKAKEMEYEDKIALIDIIDVCLVSFEKSIKGTNFELEILEA